MPVISNGKLSRAMIAVKTLTKTAMNTPSDGINNTTMRFNNPVQTSGDMNIYSAQFASGWSAPDYDGDTLGPGNCATNYSSVTQHYSACWNVNLGSDADVSGGQGGLKCATSAPRSGSSSRSKDC